MSVWCRFVPLVVTFKIIGVLYMFSVRLRFMFGTKAAQGIICICHGRVSIQRALKSLT